MKRRKLWFMAPDTGAEGSGSAADVLDVPTEAPVADEGVEEVVAEEPKTPVFDPSSMASAFGEALAKHSAAQPKAEPAKLSPEEAKKLLNVWEPDDAFVTRFSNLETQKSAIIEMRDAMMKQADTVAQIRMQKQREDLEAQYNPLRDAIARQEAAAQESRFASAYPDVGKPELKPLVASVTQSLIAEGRKFTSEADAFKEVATRVAAVIKVSNPTFKLSSPSAGRKSDGGIPVTTPGTGGGGGSGTKPQATGKSRALSLLGDVTGG